MESFGVLHTEVDFVLAMATPWFFGSGYLTVTASAFISVFESWDISSVSRVRAAPLRVLRFLLPGYSATAMIPSPLFSAASIMLSVVLALNWKSPQAAFRTRQARM